MLMLWVAELVTKRKKLAAAAVPAERTGGRNRAGRGAQVVRHRKGYMQVTSRPRPGHMAAVNDTRVENILIARGIYRGASHSSSVSIFHKMDVANGHKVRDIIHTITHALPDQTKYLSLHTLLFLHYKPIIIIVVKQRSIMFSFPEFVQKETTTTPGTSNA